MPDHKSGERRVLRRARASVPESDVGPSSRQFDSTRHEAPHFTGFNDSQDWSAACFHRNVFDRRHND
jgi:hypothetical protein